MIPVSCHHSCDQHEKKCLKMLPLIAWGHFWGQSISCISQLWKRYDFTIMFLLIPLDARCHFCEVTPSLIVLSMFPLSPDIHPLTGHAWQACNVMWCIKPVLQSCHFLQEKWSLLSGDKLKIQENSMSHLDLGNPAWKRVLFKRTLCPKSFGWWNFSLLIAYSRGWATGRLPVQNTFCGLEGQGILCWHNFQN